MQEEENDIFEEDDFDLRQFLFKFLRYWYVYLICVAVALVGAYYYNWYQTPVYRITSKVLIKDDSNSPVSKEELLKDLNLSKSQKNIENEIEILKSYSILKRTIDQVEVDVSYSLVGDIKVSEVYTQCPFRVLYDSLEFFAYVSDFHVHINSSKEFEWSYNVEATEEEFETTGRFGDSIVTPVGTFRVIKRSGFSDEQFDNADFDKRDYLVQFHDKDNLIKYYSSGLSIEPLGSQSSIIQLSINDAVPQRGIDFINALIREYLKSDIEQKNRIASSTATFIEDRLEDISKDLSVIESDQEAYKTERGIVSISEESKLVLDKLKDIDKNISEYKLKLSFINYLEKYAKDNSDLSEMAPSSLDIKDPMLVNLIARINKLEFDKKKKEMEVGDNTPGVIAIQKEIDHYRKALLENIGSIKVSYESSLEKAEEEQAKLEGEIRTIPATERELVSQERLHRIKESLYLYLLEKKEETAIALAASISDNRIIDPARATGAPISPVPMKNYAIAVLLALLLPTGVIFLKDFLDTRIRDQSDISSITSVPIIGVVGYNKDEDNLVVFNKPKALISEAFRTIRTNLNYLVPNKEKKTLLVTSSVGGEGKTFNAMNLAAIIALSGKSCVLVGCDLRKPKIVKDFGLNNELGISTYLAGEHTLDEILKDSEFNEHIKVISSGPIPPNPSELLLTDKMEQLVKTLQEQFDYVILDTPPIGLVTDGMLLSKYADATLYIVRQDYTRKQHVQNLQKVVKEGGLTNPAIIFNGVTFSSGFYGYGKGYGYGYGYAYGYGYGYYEEDKKGGLLKKMTGRRKKS